MDDGASALPTENLKVEKMEETYTFSRALHMMRYGGKKMQPMGYASEFFVKDQTLYWTLGGRFHEAATLGSSEIMGSWIEVKDE